MIKSLYKCLVVISILLACTMLSGCATTLLWRSDQFENIEAVETRKAETGQIFVSYIKVNEFESSGFLVNASKYCVPFRLKESDNNHAFSFPKIKHGYLIVIDKTGGYYSEKESEQLANKNFASIAAEIKQVATQELYAVKVNKKGNLELNLTFRKKDELPDIYKSRLHTLKVETEPPFKDLHYHTNILRTAYKKSNQVETSYYPLCCREATILFSEKCDHEGWIALLPEDKAPLSMSFSLLEPEKVYAHTLTERLLETPFTVAFDIVTFPIQLLLFSTAEHWWPR